MTAPKTKPTPVTTAVKAIPDIAQMEKMISETAAQTAPTISRTQTERNKMMLRRKELERERADFADRRNLLQKQYESADKALLEHELDITEALTLFPGIDENAENR